MRMKKYGAIIFAAGLLLSSMTALAAEVTVTDGTSVTINKTEYTVYEASAKPGNDDTFKKGENSVDVSGNVAIKVGNVYYTLQSGEWKEATVEADAPEETKPTETPSTPSDTSSSCTTEDEGSTGSTPTAKPAAVVEEEETGAVSVSAEQVISQAIATAETVALQSRVLDEGYASIGDMYSAAERNLTAGEYYNNAVVETPGIENATPVGQGGSLIVDGVVTNMTAIVSKVNIAFVDSVRAVTDGTVLNVVDVRFPAVEASVEFYMPGVAADANIEAKQYVDGTWVELAVGSVRADHVTVNNVKNGKVAFIAK